MKNTLSAYQKALEEKLPHSKGKDSFGDECIKFKKEKDRDYVCYCINTAAYIADMLPQLEQMAKNLADEKVRDSIDLQSEVMDNYYNTVSFGIKALVNGEYGKVENILYSMTSVNWATFEDIGDQSGRNETPFRCSIYHERLRHSVRGNPAYPQSPLARVLPQLLRPPGHAVLTAVLGLRVSLQARE